MSQTVPFGHFEDGERAERTNRTETAQRILSSACGVNVLFSGVLRGLNRMGRSCAHAGSRGWNHVICNQNVEVRERRLEFGCPIGFQIIFRMVFVQVAIVFNVGRFRERVHCRGGADRGHHLAFSSRVFFDAKHTIIPLGPYVAPARPPPPCRSSVLRSFRRV